MRSFIACNCEVLMSIWRDMMIPGVMILLPEEQWRQGRRGRRDAVNGVGRVRERGGDNSGGDGESVQVCCCFCCYWNCRVFMAVVVVVVVTEVTVVLLVFSFILSFSVSSYHLLQHRSKD